MNETVKYVLTEERIPKYWYNLLADLPAPPPPVLHPGTLKPIGPDDLAPLFPMSLIAQEVSTEREIEIPGPVREIYRQWRPSPRLRKAERFCGVWKSSRAAEQPRVARSSNEGPCTSPILPPTRNTLCRKPSR